jgi:iron complex outermembrane receptor protein
VRAQATESCRHDLEAVSRTAVVAAILLLARSALAAPSLEEIIVTARKAPELLALVPLEVDVVLEDESGLGMDSLQTLSAKVPGLHFESAWGGLFSAPTLRGQQASPAGDLNVGVFVDGVYQANPTAIDSGPVDVERVEVVRGPQSALFGHSTFAGAIYYVSRPPTEAPESGFTLEAGSAGHAGARAYLAGPLLGGALLSRIGLGLRSFDGTHDNAAGGGALGGAQRSSVSLQLATPARDGFTARVAARVSQARYAQPAVASLTYADYNCGAIEPASGAWSYYCGKVPLATVFDSSPGIPDSDNTVSQLAMTLSWPLGAATLTSVTSYYRGASDAYRDFDASSEGQLFGVCSLTSSCSAGGVPWHIDRSTRVNEVRRSLSTVTEWSQELRASGGSERLKWMTGGAFWKTESRSEGLVGTERGDLTENERLTAILPLTPNLVGPESLVNFALVTDPNAQQLPQSLDLEVRETLAIFGALDYAFSERLDGRLEARVTHERREVDNRIDNFEAGFGTAIAPVVFRDVTPRVSLQYLASPSLRTYASAAKGSQSGGINTIPGLLAVDQSYEPEFNWTYEVGARYRPQGGTFGIDATVYRIDWRDAQLLGFGTTPGVSSLVTLNTTGIGTQGFELSWFAQHTPLLRTELDLAWVDPAFKPGSDDPGSRRFCGLSGGNTTSTFCVIGPSRDGTPVLVPYIDGNVPARVPQRAWHAAIAITPRTAAGRLLLRLDASGQDDVFDRAINGARFGQRTLIDARISYDFGAWQLALWGRNLGDENYVRALASRGQVYFPTSPRPLDALFAEGYTVGLSVSYTMTRRGALATSPRLPAN